MMLSGSIHVSTNDPISFLFMAEKYSCVCIYHIFIQSYVDGHLGCFHVLAMVDIQFYGEYWGACIFSIMVFPGHMSRCGIAGLYGRSIFNF